MSKFLKVLYLCLVMATLYIFCTNYNSRYSFIQDKAVVGLLSHGWTLLAYSHTDSTVLKIEFFTSGQNISVGGNYLLENDKTKQYFVFSSYGAMKIEMSNIVELDFSEVSKKSMVNNSAFGGI